MEARDAREARSELTAEGVQSGGATYGVLSALAQEIGPFALAGAGGRRHVAGVEVGERRVGRARVLACVAGPGKVRAAHAAAALLAAGPLDALFVVGTCGAVSPGLAVGDLLHCERAIQADLALREGRELTPDRSWARAWAEVAPGPSAWFLTADRPVLSWWRRRALRRAYGGAGGAPALAADMETAAVAAVCSRAGVPWAALRAVTDGANPWGGKTFRRNLPTQGPRAADTLRELLERPRPRSEPSVPVVAGG